MTAATVTTDTTATPAIITEANTLIAESIRHDTIAHAWHEKGLAARLESLCDGSVEDGPIVEFWGTEDGEDWHVILDREEEEEVDW